MSDTRRILSSVAEEKEFSKTVNVAKLKQFRNQNEQYLAARKAALLEQVKEEHAAAFKELEQLKIKYVKCDSATDGGSSSGYFQDILVDEREIDDSELTEEEKRASELIANKNAWLDDKCKKDKDFMTIKQRLERLDACLEKAGSIIDDMASALKEHISNPVISSGLQAKINDLFSRACYDTYTEVQLKVAANYSWCKLDTAYLLEHQQGIRNMIAFYNALEARLREAPFFESYTKMIAAYLIKAMVRDITFYRHSYSGDCFNRQYYRFCDYCSDIIHAENNDELEGNINNYLAQKQKMLAIAVEEPQSQPQSKRCNIM